MTSEARLKELAAILANHPFLGMAVDEINRLEEEAAEAKLLRERVGELEGVLLLARKDLDFVHGLFASDDVALIKNTPSGIWRLDMSNINQKIDAALSQANAQANAEAKLETRSEEEEG